MKILFVGATGMIGGGVLKQCLAHPSVTSVVAFARRELPANLSNNPKLSSVIIKDFAAWPEDVLQAHSDAAGMIWTMGTNTGSQTADLEYPETFIKSMGRVLESKPSRTPFKYVHLSGKFVIQDQDKKLWVNDKPRKLKGLLDARALEYAKTHASFWKTFIVMPGGVVGTDMKIPGTNWGYPTLLTSLLGENSVIQIEQLGAFMTYLAVDGSGEETVSRNLRMVTRGKELLKSLGN